MECISANAHINNEIGKTILIAASGYPKEFRKGRDKMIDMLSLCEHQYKSSWRKGGDGGIKSTNGNVATAAIIVTGTPTMQEVPETEQPQNTSVKKLLEIEQPENTSVKYKYKAFRVGPMRLKIVRQPHISHEQNSQDNLDLNKQHIKSNSLHKLNSSDDKCAKEKIEATKKRLQEGFQPAEKVKKQRTIHVLELQDLPTFKSHKPIVRAYSRCP